MNEIRNTLREIARLQLDWNDELPVGPLVEAFDSLEMMTLVVAVEDTFAIALEPEDEERIATIDDLVEAIERKTHA